LRLNKLKKVQKSIIIIAVLIDLFVVVWAYKNPIIGFEYNIYKSIPTTIWASLILTNFIGYFILLYESYSNKIDRRNYWICGLIIVIITRLIILNISFIRGYYAYEGDHISHMMSIQDFVNANKSIGGDYYIFSYVISFILLRILKLDIGFTNYISSIYSVFFIMSYYLVSKEIFNDKRMQVASLGLVGSTLLPIYGRTHFIRYEGRITPGGWSYLFMPFCIYLYLKQKNSKQISLPLIIILIIMPTFHPLTAAILLYIYTILNSHNKNNNTTSTIDYNIIFGGLVLAFWILSQGYLISIIPKMIVFLQSASNTGGILFLERALDSMNKNIYDVVKLVVNQTGDNIIFYLLTAITTVSVYTNKKKDNYITQLHIIIYSILILYIIYFFQITTILNSLFGYRYIAYSILLTPLAIIPIIRNISTNKNKNKFIIIVSLLLCSSIISTYSLHPSEYTFQMNRQITFNEISAYRWQYNNQHPKYEISSFGSSPSRKIDYIIPTNEQGNRFYSKNPKIIIPEHFYYDISTLGEFSNNSYYITVSAQKRLLYLELYSYQEKYSEQDFHQINNDIIARRVYNNGETDMWAIN
jgi:hypothetical protein